METKGGALEFNGKLLCLSWDCICDNNGDCGNCLKSFKISAALYESERNDLLEENQQLRLRLHLSKRDNRNNRDKLRRQVEELKEYLGDAQRTIDELYELQELAQEDYYD